MAQRRGSTAPTTRPGAKRPDNRQTILTVTFGILALLAIGAVAWSSRLPKVASVAPTSAVLTVGQVAPPFSVSTTAGAFDLAQAAGKPVLLEVFATWCPHCQRETASLNELYDAYRETVHIVAVSGSQFGVDGSTPESQADVVAFAEKYAVRYPIAFDPTLDVANKYLQGGFPTLVVIGKDGKIVKFRDGEIPIAEIKKDLEAALHG
jgi:thiol-disulfide isomerase/thioredoxin